MILALELIFGTVFGGVEEAKYTLHVQNLDLVGGPSELSTTLINVLNSTGAFKIENLSPDVDVATYVREHPSFTSYRILVIPENFQRRAVNKSILVRTGVIIDTLLIARNYVGEN